MKVGETVPVAIAGDVVAQAKIVEVDKENSTVTMIVPPTKVVMGLRVELDPSPAPVDETAPETIITGVDRVDPEGNVVAPAGSAGESATVVENQEVTNTAETSDGTVTNPPADTGGTPEGTATQTELVEPSVEV